MGVRLRRGRIWDVKVTKSQSKQRQKTGLFQGIGVIISFFISLLPITPEKFPEGKKGCKTGREKSLLASWIRFFLELFSWGVGEIREKRRGKKGLKTVSK